MQIDPIVERRLLDAWDKHGEFGPAFAEVYEQVTGAVDALEGVLRNGATPASINAEVQRYVNATQHEQRQAVWAMREAGLSLRGIAMLVSETVYAVAVLAHNNLEVSDYIALDDLLHGPPMTAVDLAAQSGASVRYVYKLANRLGVTLVKPPWRRSKGRFAMASVQ